VQVWLAFVIYYFSAYRFVQTDRTMLLPFDQEWAGLIITRIGSAVEKVVLLVSPGNRWIFVSLGILALIGYLMGGFSIFRLAKSSLEKSLLLGIYLLTIPMLGLTVPGFAVLFQDYTPHAKMLLGLAPVLMASFLFSQRAMSVVHPKVVWLLLLPVFCMLSFSFMYGRVLMAQKVLESSVLNAIAYDLNSREAFSRIDTFYLVGPEHEQMWLPASSAAARETPALFYVGAWSKEPHNYLVLAEHFPSVGITNVRHMAAEEFKRVTVRESLVNSRFYTIYVSGNEGYIQMKQGKDNGEVSDAGHEGMP
jgi:hypothetical protein